MEPDAEDITALIDAMLDLEVMPDFCAAADGDHTCTLPVDHGGQHMTLSDHRF